jgi:hypothetical protein
MLMLDTDWSAGRRECDIHHIRYLPQQKGVHWLPPRQPHLYPRCGHVKHPALLWAFVLLKYGLYSRVRVSCRAVNIASPLRGQLTI